MRSREYPKTCGAVRSPCYLPHRAQGMSVEGPSVDRGRDRLAIPGHRGAMCRKNVGASRPLVGRGNSTVGCSPRCSRQPRTRRTARTCALDRLDDRPRPPALAGTLASGEGRSAREHGEASICESSKFAVRFGVEQRCERTGVHSFPRTYLLMSIVGIVTWVHEREGKLVGLLRGPCRRGDGCRRRDRS